MTSQTTLSSLIHYVSSLLAPLHLTYPLAAQELQRGVDVAQVVRPSEDSASLHGQPLSREDLQQRKQLHSVAKVLNQVLNLHWRLPLAEVRVNPVDECLALNSFLFI